MFMLHKDKTLSNRHLKNTDFLAFCELLKIKCKGKSAENVIFLANYCPKM